MHPIISSPQNPKIKNILALEKPRERKSQGAFVVEGLKEVTLAKEGSYTFRSIFFCPSIIDEGELIKLGFDESLLIPVHQTVFEKIAYRESTGGLIGIADQKDHRLEPIKLGENPLLLILESVEKPGNLGALLRTADAAGVDAVIICDPQTDFYNPNVIRSSVGCVFTKQLASESSATTIEWLKRNKIAVFCTSLQASIPYHRVDYTRSCAIVMGTEATGLSDIWLENGESNIIIPMQGKIDSMNVSTAAAVVIFEAKRQRNFQ
jgi:RNA methyltransferase, TrmH family